MEVVGGLVVVMEAVVIIGVEVVVVVISGQASGRGGDGEEGAGLKSRVQLTFM